MDSRTEEHYYTSITPRDKTTIDKQVFMLEVSSKTNMSWDMRMKAAYLLSLPIKRKVGICTEQQDAD